MSGALNYELDAKYYPGQNTGLADANLLRRDQYAFDRSGNRTQQIVTLAGTPTTTNYSYNATNQLTSDGVNTLTYDNNGNLTGDGTNTYIWDRANRLLSMGGAAYVYDGAGNRVQQTVGANVTQYLLDVQPGLAVVLAETTGANTVRYVHGPRGVHALKNASGNWEWPIQDGLGSVRGVVDNNVVAQESRNYDPYGTGFGATGTSQTNFGFTGEYTDPSTQLVYLRNRYFSPAIGQFISLDQIEVPNRYGYVNGNPINRTDPLGFQGSVPTPPAPILVPTTFPAVESQQAAQHLIDQFHAFYGLAENAFAGIEAAGGNEAVEAEVIGAFGTMGIVIAAPEILAAAGILLAAGFLAAFTVGFIYDAFDGAANCPSSYSNDPRTRQCSALSEPTPPAITATQPAPQTDTSPVVPIENCGPEPIPTPSSCDPNIFRDWWGRRREVGKGTSTADWYTYEQAATRSAPGALGGNRPRRIPAGSEEVDADGAIGSNCRLLDAKYNFGTTPPPWGPDIPDEFRRYYRAVTESNGTPGAQPSGLEVRINNNTGRSYFENLLTSQGFVLNTNAFVRRCQLVGVVLTCDQ